RELREEAELAADSWRLLLSTFASAGLTTEVHDIFLARALRHEPRGTFELHAEEAEMETLWVPMAELLDAVLAGRVRQGPLAQAVLAYDVLKGRGALDDDLSGPLDTATGGTSAGRGAPSSTPPRSTAARRPPPSPP